LSPHTDSTTNKSQFIVSKEKNRLSISSIDPAGPDSYSEIVTFTGVTPDGFLVYTGPKNNPVFAVSAFDGVFGYLFPRLHRATGARQKELCASQNHYFGNAPTNILR
jgi:hypothetical protein